MKKNLVNKLKTTNIVVTAHIFASGPALDLETFLKDKVSKMMFIGHPFSYRKETGSFKRYYSRGKLLKNSTVLNVKLPNILMYFKDIFLTLYWVLNFPGKVNYYFGSDGFVAYLGLLLKKIGKVENVVLYTIDFMPTRFQSPLLNWLYHYFDEQCLKNCKVVWNLSDKMAKGREEYMKSSRINFVPQLTAPLGIWRKRIPKMSFRKRNRHQMIFLGHLLKKQGLDIVIESLPKIIKKIPEVKLLITGTGGYEQVLKTKTKKLKLENYIEFTGYVEKHEDVERMLSEGAIAVATYKPDPDSFTYFADPGKIKNYLGAGLPVILTDVPPIAKEIALKECALITEYDISDFSDKAVSLLENSQKLEKYSQNAFKYAKNFDWEKIFPRALEKTLNE